MPIIEVNHVTKEYQLGTLKSIKESARNALARLRGQQIERRPPFKALDDVDFKVEQGEVLGIIGHNGAGKSTLLKMLARISVPTHGSVKVHGKVAPLIEVGAGLVQDLTGRENIYLNGTILGMKRAEIDRKFDEIVAFSEMEEFIDTPIKRYSSGMQVRLGFSIATSVDADILIVDEVLAVGDLAFQRKCFDRMEDLIKKQGKTVLLVSHNIRQVERLCSRVVLMSHGRAIEDGNPKNVCNSFYDASDKRIHATKGQHSINGRTETSGDVELNEIRMVDISGRQTNEIQYQQDIEFQITYTVHKTLPSPIFGIGIHTTDFLYLATSQSVDALSVGDVSPGTYVLHFGVKRFPFLPGIYSLRLGVALEGAFQPVFYSENVAQFHVVSGTINRAVMSAENEGFIALEGDWSFSREGSQQHAAQVARP